MRDQPHGPRIGRLKFGGRPVALSDLPRCGAYARSTGRPCRRIAVKVTGKCKLHGGKSTGAPKGERNGAFKSGRYSLEAMADRRRLRNLIRAALALIGR